METEYDPEYDPKAHVVERQERRPNGFAWCRCGWVGKNFEMHLVAVKVTDEVFRTHVINEEEEFDGTT